MDKIGSANKTLPEWSAPYYGSQHLEDPDNSRRWATVHDCGSYAILSCWYPGCGFSPKESRHDSVDAARAAGERYIAEGR